MDMDAETQQEGDVQVIHCEIIQAVERWGTVNVFVICLDREEGDHNIIDRNFGWQLAKAVLLALEKARKGEVDVVAVCSAKEGSFMAGADILHELKFVGVEGGQRYVSRVGVANSTPDHTSRIGSCMVHVLDITIYKG